MYQINKTVQSEGSSTKIFPLGISEDAEMTNVSVETASNGNSFLKFSFSLDGANLSHLEWPIDTAVEGWEKKMTSQMKRVKHIMTKFLEEDRCVITADSFEKFCEQVITLLGNSYVGKKLRMKTVYSYNNYVSVPKYVPFMETMDVEKTRLNITSFDKMEKDEAENPASLASTANAATEPAESDLPF
jgi:hypothetical protein|tara:strand:+ start:9905 stop:10465 length:561 start_codon:yes stop_codon:yes gene_type:complete